MGRAKETSTNFENKQKLSTECAEIYSINLIGGQWTLAICCVLIQGKLRFGELRSYIPDITERMLALELRKMEENKLVKRTAYAEVPPRVEYELTDIAMKLTPIIQELQNWGKEHMGLMGIDTSLLSTSCY